MPDDLVPTFSGKQLPARFTPLPLSFSAMLNGMRWVAGPGTGKTRGIALTVVWPHLWHGLPAIIIDPTGALCSYVLNKALHFGKRVQRQLWQRLRYVDVAATDSIQPLPLYRRHGEETLFAVANRLPEVLKRQDPDLVAAPIMGWNSLFECAVYAGQIATALGRQLDFVAGLVALPGQHKEELRQVLAAHPELDRAVAYFRQLMDPKAGSLRDRRTGSFLTKIVPFLADPTLQAMFATHAPGIDWAEEIRVGRTVLLDFGGETDRERRQFKLIWCFLEIVEFLKYRGIAGRNQPVLLVIDEISALLGPRIGDRSILGQDLHELITVYARNFGIKCCFALQYPSQLEPTINYALTQMGTQVIGNVQDPDDALYLARQFHRYDPHMVRKHEPVWMNVQHGAGRLSYSVPEVIDYRITEFTPDEQYIMAADTIRSLPQFHFLVRPALGEGNLTGRLRRMTLERLDAGLYPDDDIIAEVRRRLRRRDGMPVADLLGRVQPPQPAATPVNAAPQNAILEGDEVHAQTPRPLPARKRKRPHKPAKAPKSAGNDESWQDELWQKGE